jgi:hypothetical protein
MSVLRAMLNKAAQLEYKQAEMKAWAKQFAAKIPEPARTAFEKKIKEITAEQKDPER